MNKIISANINGFVFNIDEMAYDKLKQYLETIRQRVNNQETIMDIENRIAELFDYRLKNGSQAIFDRDVEDIMSQIGSPEQFGQEETESRTEKTETSYSYNERRKYRRMYRNDDDKVIGGVCSGIAAYFGIDPLFLRIGFGVSFFVFGAGFLFYIFLMVILPKAITPAEKLEMMGEPVDFNNLGKTIEKDFKDAYVRYKPEMKTGFERFVEIMVKVGSIVLIVLMISIFVPVGIGLFTSIGVASWFLPTMNSYIFMSPNEGIIVLIGLILFFIIPLIGGIYKLIRVAFKTRPMNKYVSISLSLFWFIGFCLLAYSTYSIGKEFSISRSIVTTDTLDIKPNTTLVIRANTTGGNQRFIISDDEGEHHHRTIHSSEDAREFIDELDDEIGRNVRLKIVRGYGSKPVVKVIRRSSGNSGRSAYLFAERISYDYSKDSSSIILNDHFTKGEARLWRNQKVRIILEIPKDMDFILDGTCDEIMNDTHFDDYDHHDENAIFDKKLHIDDKGKIVN